MSDWSILHGDCRSLMAEMEGCSIDSIVTDPPYDLTTGKKGGSGPASVNLDTPAGRARIGTGALNIDACRIHGEDAQGGSYTVKRLKPGATLEKTGGNWRPDGDGPLYHGEMKAGRWPANVVHDGSDEVVGAFPDAPGQLADAKLTGERKTGRVYGAMGYPRFGEASAQSVNDGSVGFQMRPGARRLDTGSAARFFYCAKAGQADRDEGLDHFTPQTFVHYQTGNGASGKPSSLSADRDTQHRNTHPTVKPEALMRWLVRLVTPEGGLVLDPFTGSGSTGKAAMLEGRRFVGCELTADYLPIARARIATALDRAGRTPLQHSLFGDDAL